MPSSLHLPIYKMGTISPEVGQGCCCHASQQGEELAGAFPSSCSSGPPPALSLLRCRFSRELVGKDGIISRSVDPLSSTGWQMCVSFLIETLRVFTRLVWGERKGC